MVGVCSPFSIKTTYYLHRYYLGSITQISDNSGNLAAEYSYDAWGRMRNITNWQVYAATEQPTLMFGRGYTGHEHLNQFGLINMNARLYDPVLARFLAPDPFVGSGLTNDFNRYIYCRNNPLMFTDPSGEFYFEIGWGSKRGFFYRATNGNSGFSGSYNTSSGTFTAGSTYYGYQTSAVIYQQSQYNQKNSLSHVPIGHYYTNYTTAWMANSNTIRVNLESTRHDVYADYSFGLTNGVIQNGTMYSGMNASGLGLALVGAGLTASEIKMFNENSWFSLKQMKTYNQSFNGNGYTGGKIASAERISTKLKWTGRAIGAYNAYSTSDNYISGKISDSQMVIEQSSNIYSTFGGIYGAAWGIGWELGRSISNLNSYQDFKQNTWIPWRKENLGY